MTKRIRFFALSLWLLFIPLLLPAQEWLYFGQKPPGLGIEIFAPGIISTGYFERSVVFSPSLNELFFQLRGIEFTSFILTMKMKDGRWSKPEVASFSGYAENNDDCPFMSYDGKTLFFISRRPLPGTKELRKEPDIWMIQKGENEWGEPQPLSPIVNSTASEDYPTVSKNNNIYFCSNRDGNYDIYMSEYSAAGYRKPVRLEAPINTSDYEGHPFIAADESYLIFSSDRPGELGQADLYISFKGKDGRWTKAVNMGDKINSPYHEAAPYVSPDGKYMFFCSFRPVFNEYYGRKLDYREVKRYLDGPGNGFGDVYWVDAKIIEELKKQYFK